MVLVGIPLHRRERNLTELKKDLWEEICVSFDIWNRAKLRPGPGGGPWGALSVSSTPDLAAAKGVSQSLMQSPHS